MPTVRHSVVGRITTVQEQRFHLVTGDGRGMLFTLGKHAHGSVGDLLRWKAGGDTVTVQYQGEPNLSSGVAQSVSLTPQL